MKNYTEKQIEVINKWFNNMAIDESGKLAKEYIEYYGSEKNITIENKVEELWEYYTAAGFDIKTDEDFCRLLGI